MFLCCILAAAGFVLVAVANNDVISILGVVCTSLSSGLGELTFLAYSSKYHKYSTINPTPFILPFFSQLIIVCIANVHRNVVSTWSSGTGGAGIVGSLSYAVMIGAGLTPKTTMLIMLVAPVLEAVAFWGILSHDNHVYVEEKRSSQLSNNSAGGVDNKAGTFDSTVSVQARSDENLERDGVEELEPLVGFKSKIRYIPRLFKYMIPLTLVYLLEYFINQGLVKYLFLLL